MVRNPPQNKPNSSFASHLILPVESDQQATSFQPFPQKVETGLRSARNPQNNNHTKLKESEDILVHF
jgi:hypothetical protein